MFLLKGDSGTLIMGGASFIGLGAIWLWIFHNRLIFSAEGITHGRFRPFVRALAFSEIKDFYTFIGFRDDRGRSGPFVRLVIEPTAESSKKAILIPFKLFSPTDSAAIIKFLSDHLPPREIRSAKRRRAQSARRAQ